MRIHLSLVATFLVTATACSIHGAWASAATLQWLEDGHTMVAPAAAEGEGEVLLRNSNGGGFDVNIEVLCSGSFIGSVGPGAESTVTSLLSLTGVGITLANPLECENESNCASALVAPVGLPVLVELELMTGPNGEELFLGKGRSGGAGSPGLEIDCITIFGLIEEICSGSTGIEAGGDLVNDAAENDVLGEVTEAEIVAEGEQATCTGGGGKTGVAETDGAGLGFLTNGKVLSVSYE